MQSNHSLELRRSTQTYPVLTLPPEIVSEIFLNYLPAYPDCPSLLGTDSPVLLSQICQHWRQISLSTPALWRAISVEREMIAQLDLLESWLSRSGGLPLSLCLVYFSDFSHLPQVLQTLVVHCERWESVELNVPFEHLPFIQGSMPVLQNLTIGATVFPQDETAITLFDRAPQLKAVNLTDFYIDNINLPWAQLTHVDGCLYEYECTKMLQDAEHLVQCRLTVCFSSRATLPVVHSTLRDLKFRGDSDGEVEELLNHLTLPALRTLRFFGPHITLDTLQAFISRSHCALEELCIDCPTLSEAKYREALPSVRTITLKPRDK